VKVRDGDIRTLEGWGEGNKFLKIRNVPKYAVRKIPADGFCIGCKNLLLEIDFLLAVYSLCLCRIYFLGHPLDFNIPCCVLLRCQTEVQN